MYGASAVELVQRGLQLFAEHAVAVRAAGLAGAGDILKREAAGLAAQGAVAGAPDVRHGKRRAGQISEDPAEAGEHVRHAQGGGAFRAQVDLGVLAVRYSFQMRCRVRPLAVLTKHVDRLFCIVIILFFVILLI